MQKLFSTEDEIINLEWAAKNDKKPPKGKKYQYKVDEVELISETETKTGKQILEAAGKIPAANFILRQKLKGTWITIKPDAIVDFTEPGVEKFKTLPNDQTEGGSVGNNNTKSLRRDFVLLEEDQQFLDSLNLPWEAVKQGNTSWVFVHQYSIVEGYNTDVATIAIRISPGYPTSQLDMVYFYPKLQRADGQPVLALTDFPLDGKIFQQWSRHRTSLNAWRPGVDNLSTHYPLAEAWLLKEFEKRPYHAKTA